MALACGCACDRVAPDTGAELADVGQGASVRIVAGAAVGLGGVGTAPSYGVAGAGVIALADGCAGDRVAANAEARLARVGQGASVRVVARTPVRFGGVGATPGGWVAGARLVTLTRRSAGHWCASTVSAGTRVAEGARISIVAVCAVRTIDLILEFDGIKSQLLCATSFSGIIIQTNGSLADAKIIGSDGDPIIEIEALVDTG